MSVTQAIHQVETLHQEIQSLFNQPDQPERLSSLMKYFSAQFEMVGISGARLNIHQLEEMFSHKMGAFPDLKIEVSQIRVIMQTADFVLLAYQETHHKSGHCHHRIATACIEFHVEQCIWRYLHETTISESS